MGNLLVVNRQPADPKTMRQLFMSEIKRQKKPYGIWVKDTLGGETGTSSYDFQAFKGEILDAVRVFPDGREEPIRGVDFVGTPLSSLDSVVCLGDDPTLNNHSPAQIGGSTCFHGFPIHADAKSRTSGPGPRTLHAIHCAAAL